MSDAVAHTFEVATTAERLWMVCAAAHLFDALGYGDIKARMDGWVPPTVLQGSKEDHRPDVTARQTDKGGTYIILDCVPVSELGLETNKCRWELFASAAQQYKCEFHLITSAWSPGISPAATLRAKLERLKIVPNKIWVL